MKLIECPNDTSCKFDIRRTSIGEIDKTNSNIESELYL